MSHLSQPARPREKHPQFWMFSSLGVLCLLIGIALLKRDEILTGGLLALAGVGILAEAVTLRAFSAHVKAPSRDALEDPAASEN